MARFKAQGYQPRFSTEVFSHTVFIPPEDYATPGRPAAPSGATLSGLKARGHLVTSRNANGQIITVTIVD